jgi:hypothetical protein
MILASATSGDIAVAVIVMVGCVLITAIIAGAMAWSDHDKRRQ